MNEATIQTAQTFFPELKGKLGFGLMRLPMTGDRVDFAQTVQMVDAYLAAGFCYFDTAHGYISGQSETAVRTCWRGAPADPVHGLPLLYGRLSDGDPDSGYPASAQPAHDVSFLEQAPYYSRELTKESGKASDCIGCGQCADVCPQHLDIPALLQEAAQVFE